jgi:PAS domain S-box-containing protein
MARTSAKRAADMAQMAKWLFDNSRDLMQVVSPDGVLLQVNRAWSEFTGLSERELVGRSVLEFCHPDEVPAIRARAAASTPGDISEAEVRLRDRDGAWVWVAARRQVMDDGCYIGNMRDISAERAYREEVEEARRTRKMLGASAGIGMWTFEPLENRIEWADELNEMVGLPRGAVLTPESFAAMLPAPEREAVLARFNRAVTTGAPDQFEHRVRMSGGGYRTFRATVRAEPRGEALFALKGISEDITELVHARDAARKGELQMRKARREAAASARRLKLALQAAEAGVYEIDHVRRTFWASPEFARITGEAEATYEAASKLRFPRFHPDDLPHVRASFRALHRGEVRSGEGFEARVLRPDGSERWVRVYHHLLVSKGGRWLKAVGLVQDCDVLKRQELALKQAQRDAEVAAEAKAAFLANMSHEIRTPMNGVMGVLHLLSGERLSDEGRALLAEALSCGRMLAELLNDVIDFSKIEAGRLELAEEPVDPAALAHSVVRLLEPQARAKGLQMRVEADPALGWVRSDPVRLRQGLFNLVGNAVKFTEAGHVAVRVGRAGSGALRFEVEDTGVGIPEAAKARLFERFNQADASTTRKFGGSGLGLAITRRLAQLIDGDVGFTSIEGQGSSFWLEVRAEAAAAETAPETPGQAVLEGVRVLVVEDNATNRLIATRLLETLGADVETASDGYLGVEAAARGDFDLILMDIQMPGIDGLEAARRIRSLGGPSAETPIVALTANVLAHQRQSYLDSGMDGVVGKPISPPALLSEIAAAAQHRAEQAASKATAAA